MIPAVNAFKAGYCAPVNAPVEISGSYPWNLNANWTGNKSKIVELDGNEQNIQGIAINKIGHPLNSVYIVRYSGVNAENGEAQYITKDGKTTETYDPEESWRFR